MPQYHFTASYGNFINSFSILGIPDGKTPNELDRSFTCILRNILSRSDCTRPSVYLREKIGLQESEKNFTGKEFALGLIDKNSPLPRWDKTIKGAENGFNPALDFFYDDALWNRYLPDFAWVRHLIIPEAPLDRILTDFSGKWEDQTVDFFLPAANLVIEIDGSQHRKDYAQARLDQTRDSALKKVGIETIRISASSILAKDRRFEQAMCEISDRIHKENGIKPYVLFDISDPELEIRLRYEKILRYQFLLLQLIENGFLSLQDDRWCFRAQVEDQELFTLAAEDLFRWYENLYALKNLTLTKPEIRFSDGADTISIMQSLFERPDERDYKGIVILSDPWDGAQYSYYRVSCAEPVDYQIPWPSSVDGRQGVALEFYLKNIFGFEDGFKPGQWEIISSFMNRRKTIGILPTGGGKSLCYQLAALLQPAISFAVCPIVSLLMDQKKNLDQFWDRTEYLQGGQAAEDKQDIIKRFNAGKLQLIWIAPERLQSRAFRDALRAAAETYTMGFAVIDEVHCLSEWGHDFRTSYLTLIDTIEATCPQAVIVGLTATASMKVLEDLKIEMKIDDAGVRALPSLKRTNLTFEVIKTEEQEKSLIDILRSQGYESASGIPHNGLVFTLTRDQSDNPESGSHNKTANLLRTAFPGQKDRIGVFHAGIEDKQDVQTSFIDKDGQLTLLSATKAFGMGVNKKDIHFTVHSQLPWSVESFYQEAGRAGRDENIKAHCFILYAPKYFGSKEEVERFFARDITSEEIGELKIGGDLGTISYLWRLNNKGVDNEVTMIHKLRARLNEAYISQKAAHPKYVVISADKDDWKDNQSPNPKNLNKARLELALYRLKLLGVVKDWLIDWRGNGTFEVYWDSKTEDSVSTHFYKYIRNHISDFGNPWKDDTTRYKRILENTDEDFVERHARALITWTYDHILYSRRTATKNILDYCEKYNGGEKEKTDAFRDAIDNFLRIPDQAILLNGIVRDMKQEHEIVRDMKQEQWPLWFELFVRMEKDDEHVAKERKLTPDELNALNAAVRRYLESYENNTGLDLAFVLSKATCFSLDVNDEKILESALRKIVSMPDSDSIYAEIVKCITTYKENISAENLERLTRPLLKHYPDKARELYARFHDRTSLAVLLRARTRRIQAAMEEVI